MFHCPHCEKRGIPPLRKMILSPGLTAICQACNGTSGIRYPSWIKAMLPGTILMIVALFMDSEPVEWALNLTGFALMIILPTLFTPLHKEI